MAKKIAFLGPKGTFTEEAARHFFNSDDVYLPYESIPDVLEAVDKREVNFAIVPLENSIEGSVNLTLDWLIHQIELPIRSELVLPINQHLLANGENKMKTIKKVFSHPQAVAQCRNYLRNHLMDAEIIYTNSTAEAAKKVSEHPEQPWAAIGTMLAKEIYQLEFLQEHIQDYHNNYTRFIVVSKEIPQLVESELFKTMILITLPKDYPGALHQVLSAFAWRKINLSRIESRPTKTGLGNYYFIMDIEQKVDPVLLTGAFAEIEALGCHVRELGSYPYYFVSNNLVKHY